MLLYKAIIFLAVIFLIFFAFLLAAGFIQIRAERTGNEKQIDIAGKAIVFFAKSCTTVFLGLFAFLLYALLSTV